jgi:hypothetical protein
MVRYVFRHLIFSVLLLLLLVSCNTSLNSSSLQALEQGTYTLTVKHSGKNLDVPYGEWRNGLQLHQWGAWDTPNQRFFLEPVGESSWKIINEASGMALEINDGSFAPGAPLQQWSKADVPWQLWKLVEQDGYYLIQNAHTGLVLDVQDGNTEDGGKVSQWSEDGTDKQLWKLTLLKGVPEPEETPTETPTEAPTDPVISVSPTRPDPNAVQVKVRWDKQLGIASSGLQYGLNLYKIYEPAQAVKPDYQNGVRAMKLGMVRVHRSEMMFDSAQNPAGWVKNAGSANYAWDKERIAIALKELPSYAPVRMLNIVNFPAYLKVSPDPGTMQLRPDAYDAYAAFCAELVRIVNLELKLGIQYWEVLNELDDSSSKYDNNMSEAGRIFNKAAAAMKAVDPSIKVGGPAMAQPGRDGAKDERAFLQVTKDTLDFFSFHTYPQGNPQLPLDELWDTAVNLKDVTAYAQSYILETTGRSIDIFHDEYNLTWAAPDPRMTNEISAVYDALTLESLVSSGVTGALAWNESDGWWGKLGNEYGNFSRRPSSYVFELYNSYMVGNVVDSSSNNNSSIDPFAVVTNGRKALALVNRTTTDGFTPAQQSIQVSFEGWNNSAAVALEVYQVTASGLNKNSSTPQALADGLELPGGSVTLIVQK